MSYHMVRIVLADSLLSMQILLKKLMYVPPSPFPASDIPGSKLAFLNDESSHTSQKEMLALGASGMDLVGITRTKLWPLVRKKKGALPEVSAIFTFPFRVKQLYRRYENRQLL